MKAKLYKADKGDYILVDSTKDVYDKGYLIGTSRESDVFKLSIKNCQEIKCGYDLDDKISEHLEKNDIEASTKRVQVIRELILELLGDKKFTKEDMRRIMVYGYNKSSENEYLSRIPFDEYIQSLQQTEWDVEIEMEEDKDVLVDDVKQYLEELGDKPKLDADGCLILKLK